MRIPSLSRTSLIFLGALGLVAGPITASSQVLVYKLQFETTGKTLNYDFYDGGYFVCPAPRGEGTFILTVRTQGQSLYTTADGGDLYYVEDGGKRLAVLTASGDNASYQATGDIDGARSIGGSISMPYSRDLEGYLMAAQETGDAVVGSSTDDEDGFAGYSRIKARIDTGKTREYNEDGLTVDEAVTELEAYLELNRYKEETTTTPTPTPTPTPNP
jgi:hypothetical protein